MILTAFIVACGVYVFINLWGGVQYIKNRFKLIRLKPFDCEGCLGFWSGAIVLFIQTQDIWTTIGAACISSVFSIALYLILRRL